METKRSQEWMSDEEFSRSVAIVSKSLSRRFHTYISREDLVQEAWLWALSHSSKVSEWYSLEDHTVGQRKLRRALYHACLAVAQKAKADAVGYDPDDNFYYRVTTLRKILPQIFDAGFERDAQPYSDFADRAIWLDICNALNDLSLEDYTLVERCFNGDPELEVIYAELAREQETTVKAISSRVRRILSKMQRFLGGEQPTGHRYEWVGGRRVMHNSQAMAITRNAYAED